MISKTVIVKIHICTDEFKGFLTGPNSVLETSYNLQDAFEYVFPVNMAEVKNKTEENYRYEVWSIEYNPTVK